MFTPHDPRGLAGETRFGRRAPVRAIRISRAAGKQHVVWTSYGGIENRVRIVSSHSSPVVRFGLLTTARGRIVNATVTVRVPKHTRAHCCSVVVLIDCQLIRTRFRAVGRTTSVAALSVLPRPLCCRTFSTSTSRTCRRRRRRIFSVVYDELNDSRFLRKTRRRFRRTRPELSSQVDFNIPGFQSRTTRPFFITLCATSYSRNRPTSRMDAYRR